MYRLRPLRERLTIHQMQARLYRIERRALRNTHEAEPVWRAGDAVRVFFNGRGQLMQRRQRDTSRMPGPPLAAGLGVLAAIGALIRRKRNRLIAPTRAA